MTLNHLNNQEFIDRLTELILEYLEDENLVVQKLAERSGMTANALNRRLNKINKKHLSQFIREVRLKKALELLRSGTYTAAEVSYKVGFSSPTYFNKCFHDMYGFPPGKVKNLAETGIPPPSIPEKTFDIQEGSQPNRIIWAISFSILILIIGGVVTFNSYVRSFISSFSGPDSETEKFSIVVLPFRNMTNDTVWNIWQEGIQSVIINFLSSSGDFIIRSEQSVNSIIRSEGVTSYSALNSGLAQVVSEKLAARVFISGNIAHAGGTVRITAEMISTNDASVISSFRIDGRGETILSMVDSLAVLIGNSLLIAELRKLKPTAIQDFGDYATTSPNAYKYFIYGNLAYYRNDFPTAIDWYLQALALDSTFRKPMARIATAYYNQNQFELGKVWFGRYYEKKDRMNMRDRITADVLYAVFYGNYYTRIKYCRQLLELDDRNPMTWFNIGDSYFEMMQYARAIPEFEKALELFKEFGTKPYWGAFYYELGICYHKTGQYSKERKLYQKAEKDFPNDPGLMDQQAWLELSEGYYHAAVGYLNRWLTIRREEGWSEAAIASYMAYIYSMAEMPEKVEQCHRRALLLEPSRVSRINNLAYFLIDERRNVAEGLALARKALQLAPGNYNSMHITGYGLYRQGMYEEAYELMKKSWSLRMQKSIYNHRYFLQLEAAKMAAAVR